MLCDNDIKLNWKTYIFCDLRVKEYKNMIHENVFQFKYGLVVCIGCASMWMLLENMFLMSYFPMFSCVLLCGGTCELVHTNACRWPHPQWSEHMICNPLLVCVPYVQEELLRKIACHIFAHMTKVLKLCLNLIQST